MDGLLKLDSQSERKCLGTLFAVVFVVGMDSVNFEDLSVITTINCFLNLVFDKRSKISVSKFFCSSVGGNRRSWRSILLLRRILGHDRY